MFSLFVTLTMTFFSLAPKIGVHDAVCSLHRNSNDLGLNLIQDLIYSTLTWFGHSYVSGCSIH